MRAIDNNEVMNRLIDLVTDLYRNSMSYRKGVKITADTDISRDLGFDSVMLVVLQINIEDAFHMRFDPMEEDLRNVFSTIRPLSDYISKRIDAETTYEV